MIGIELPLDPLHHAGPRDAVGFARTGSVRQPIQRMKRRIARRQRGELRKRDNEDEVHVAILTPPPVRS
jgi:hypothetical protein